ncbi:MAG: hypothetical protein JEZ02_12960 [Desulfatibacillum sp.]|nr:hypothetical protein [Desulfatibacillum sp.]
MPGKKKPAPFVIPGILLLCLCLAPGCAKKVMQPEAITTTSTSEAAPAKMRSFAVEPFQGDDRNRLVSNLSEALFQAEPAEVINQGAAALHGHSQMGLSGPYAKIVGKVESSVNDLSGTDMVTVQEGTGQFKTEKPLFGEETLVEIKRSVMKPVPYVIRRASLTVDYQVIQRGTRKILLKNTVHEALEEKFGGELEYQELADHRLRQLPTREDTLDNLAKIAAKKVAAAILSLE